MFDAKLIFLFFILSSFFGFSFFEFCFFVFVFFLSVGMCFFLLWPSLSIPPSDSLRALSVL